MASRVEALASTIVLWQFVPSFLLSFFFCSFFVVWKYIEGVAKIGRSWVQH